MNNWKKWLNGLVGAFISAGATAISTMIVDPAAFNFQAGLMNLGKVCLVNGIIGAALYLKTHPVPGSDGTQG